MTLLIFKGCKVEWSCLSFQKGVVEKFKEHYTKAPKETVFFAPFANMPDSISRQDQEALQDKAVKAIETSVQGGMRLICDYLEEHYMKNLRPHIAASSLPNGKAFYQECIRFHTSTNMTPEEIHSIGQAEVEKIESQMTAVRIKHKGL